MVAGRFDQLLVYELSNCTSDDRHGISLDAHGVALVAGGGVGAGGDWEGEIVENQGLQIVLVHEFECDNQAASSSKTSTRTSHTTTTSSYGVPALLNHESRPVRDPAAGLPNRL